LAESLSQAWHLAEVRLLNALIGVALTLTVALLIHGLRLQLNKQDKTRDGSQ
ncbi:MAG: FUSC family protein, partial [Pseudomonas sp.]|nr:FUSC family protein [Pseudomonas sp.]